MQSLGGTRKRKSDQLDMSSDAQYGLTATAQQVPTKGDMSHPDEGPAKRQRVGITAAQKQALIDNLQLEITERARKLRANYNIHAQSLRTRIEIRVNRIPLSLRKLTMGELLERCSKEVHQQKPAPLASSLRGPPVPAKDAPASRPPTRGAAAPAYPSKRRSHEITGGDKENAVQTPPKKFRNEGPSHSRSKSAVNPLSPATANSRIAPRPGTSHASSTPARPGTSHSRPTTATPGRTTTTNTSRPTTSGRSGAVTPGPGTSRKAVASSTTATNSITNSERRRRGATVTATTHQAPTVTRPATQMAARRVSGASEASTASTTNSDTGSTATVIRHKRPMTAPPGAQPKLISLGGGGAAAQQQSKRSTVMGSVKKSVTSSSTAGGMVSGKKPASSTTGGSVGKAGGTAASRVLRKRA